MNNWMYMAVKYLASYLPESPQDIPFRSLVNVETIATMEAMSSDITAVKPRRFG
jgi:hypothetical protein